jgi:AraC-like DNA-binding protein
MRFRKRFFVFVTVLLVVPPLLTSVFLFTSISGREVQATQRVLDSQVRQVSGTVDTIFSKLQADFVYLSYRNELLYLKKWAAESDYREKKEFLKNLDPFGTLSDYYDEALLVNPEDGWLVDIKNKNLSPIEGTHYQDSVDRQLSVFRNRASGNAVLFSFQMVQGRSTYLVRKIDFPAVGRSLFLCVRISESFFRKAVDDTFLGDHSFLAIFEAGHTLVSLRARGVDLDEPRVAQLSQDSPGPTGRFLISRYDSTATLWRYVYGTDRSGLDSAVITELAEASALVVGLLALLGVGTYFLSRRIYTPIGRLFHLFQGSERDDPDDLETLTTRASALIESNRQLRLTVEATRSVEREQFLQTFFDDPSVPDEAFQTEARRLGLDIDFAPGTAWAVCLVQAGQQGGLASEFLQASAGDKSAFLAQYFALGSGVHAELFHPGGHRVGFVLSLPAAAGVPLSRLFRSGEAMTFVYALAFSRVQTIWTDLKTARRQAEVALDFRPLFQERTILLYDDVVQGQKSLYFYPFEVEQKLIAALKQTNESAVQDYFSLFLDNLKLSGVSFGHVKHVFSHLADSVLQVARDFDVPLERRLEGDFANVWDRVQESTDPEQAEGLMRRFLQTILAGLSHEKKSNFDLLAATVRQRIEESYHDHNLSLDSISRDLRYSTSHLSAVFRGAYGETIKDFITQVRLEKACELLLKTDHRIGKIAQEVGYQNQGSFVKIFKTYRGETPKVFKLKAAATAKTP